ncbi:MAG: hypothetical protein KDC53_16455, partial [Saprospiraceae bacterium]|nr:hypothetical protein [Saprospiraceae bacterium]
SKYFFNYLNPLFYDNSCQQPSLGTIEVSLWISGVVSDRSKIAEERWPYIIYDNLEIVLESITPLYKDYAAYIDQLPTDVDLLFTDQHVTPTNIQGGYGIIAGKSIHSIKINIQ